MKNTIICSIAVLSAALLAACTETTRIWPEEGESKAYVEVSSQKVIFDADGGNAVITVATNADGWDYAAEGDWFTVARQDGNALLVETLINAGAETLTGKLTVSAEKNGETVSQEVALVQRAERSVNLSAEGTANCYIARTGGVYKFDASVKGNGGGDGVSDYIANYGLAIEDGAFAELLWESRHDGDKTMSREIIDGAPIYRGGYVTFSTGRSEGNAVICQNSWGYTAGTISVTDWTRGSYSALSRAMEYFNKYAGLDENGNQTGPMAGGIVLFAAGNDASSEVCYPAADANAISVGATAFTGAPAYYTNYGTWVQISAPGGDQMLSNAYGGVYSTSVAADGSSGYEGSQGTSMACPHVSGACALAVSYYYGAEKRKGLTGEMLRQALLSSTQSVDRYCTGKYQQYLGNMGIGSLDTYKLLRNIAKIDGIPAQRVGVGDTVSIDLSNHFTATNVLGYTVSVPDLVKIELRGGVMKLTGLKKGRTTIIVSDGAAIRKPIEVTVE